MKPKIGKVQNIIVSRFKTVPGGCPWKYIKEETIRNSRSQVKKSQSQEVMNLRSKEVCIHALIFGNEIVPVQCI